MKESFEILALIAGFLAILFLIKELIKQGKIANEKIENEKLSFVFGHVLDLAETIVNSLNQTVVETLKNSEELKFDKTVTGKIIDNSKANIGEYTIKEGVVEYIAYSENTSYKIDDAVYVTIPNGDYSQ